MSRSSCAADPSDGYRAFGVPLMYDVCAELRLTHTFGLSMNPRLKAASADLLAQAEQQFEATGVKQRLFLPLMYQADSWDAPRQIVIKCEAPAQGTNRRAVSTNRSGWLVNPTAVYDEYTERGGPPKRRCPRTATRNSNANWRPIASATIGSSPTSFDWTCMPPR